MVWVVHLAGSVPSYPLAELQHVSLHSVPADIVLSVIGYTKHLPMCVTKAIWVGFC